MSYSNIIQFPDEIVQLTNLKSLELSFCSSLVNLNLLKNMTSITDLTLFTLQNKKVSSFIKDIPTSVKTLDISINPEITDDNLQFIGENLTKLKYLKMYKCNVTLKSLILNKCKLLNVGYTHFSEDFIVNNLKKEGKKIH